MPPKGKQTTTPSSSSSTDTTSTTSTTSTTGTTAATTTTTAPVDTSDTEVRAALALIDNRRVQRWHSGDGTLMRTLDSQVQVNGHYYNVHLTITIADFLHIGRSRYEQGWSTTAILADTLSHARFHITVEAGGQAEGGNPHWYRRGERWSYPSEAQADSSPTAARGREVGLVLDAEINDDDTYQTVAGGALRAQWGAVQEEINDALSAAPTVIPTGQTIT